MPKRERTQDPQIFKIKKKTGFSFYFRGSLDGTLVEEKLNAANLTEARLRRDDLLIKVRSQGLAGSKLTANALFEDFLADRERECAKGEIRESTLNEVKDQVRVHLRPQFGKLALVDIDEAAWERFKRHLGKKDPTNPRKILVQFLKWCKRNKYLKHIPEFQVKRRKRRERVNLTEAEILAVMNLLPASVQLMSLLVLQLGMRPGEARELTWDRVDLVNDLIVLRDLDTKTKDPRRVPINSFIKGLLVARKAGSGSVFVFPNRTSAKKPMGRNAPIWAFARAREKAMASGLCRHVTQHDLRATFENFAHANPNFTATQLEHMVGASIEVQRGTYVRLRPEQIRGLSEVVKVDGLQQIVEDKQMGKQWEKTSGSSKKEDAND